MCVLQGRCYSPVNADATSARNRFVTRENGEKGCDLRVSMLGFQQQSRNRGLGGFRWLIGHQPLFMWMVDTAGTPGEKGVLSFASGLARNLRSVHNFSGFSVVVVRREGAACLPPFG